MRKSRPSPTFTHRPRTTWNTSPTSVCSLSVLPIMTTVKNLSTVISGAFAKILANPAILGVTLAIAAVGAIALYVYDNWKAFSDNFK